MKFFQNIFRRTTDSLADRCRSYLEKGPPASMKEYVPGSLTEIIIAHGAENRPLDGELMEIAGIIAMEASGYANNPDESVRAYMLEGARLVQEVAERRTE